MLGPMSLLASTVTVLDQKAAAESERYILAASSTCLFGYRRLNYLWEVEVRDR